MSWKTLALIAFTLADVALAAAGYRVWRRVRRARRTLATYRSRSIAV